MNNRAIQAVKRVLTIPILCFALSVVLGCQPWAMVAQVEPVLQSNPPQADGQKSGQDLGDGDHDHDE